MKTAGAGVSFEFGNSDMKHPHPALRRHQKAEWIDHSKDSGLGV